MFSTVLDDLVSKVVDVRRFVLSFEIVGNRCSWFNHSFLEQVIKIYCEGNKKTEKAHKAFCAHLKRYCIRKCPLKNGFGSGGKKDAKIVMEVDREWDDIRIEQLEEVVFNVARFEDVPLCCLPLNRGVYS